MEEEDFFSDDDLANLPDDTLQELERNAWSSTQKQSTPVTAAATIPAPRKQVHNATSLNRSVSFNRNLPWRPPQRSQPHSRPGSGARVATPNSVESATLDEYGLDDEVVIDLNDASNTGQPFNRSDAPRQLSNHVEEKSRSRHGTRSPPDSQTEAAFAAADAQLAGESFAWPARTDTDAVVDTTALQAKIAQLESEQTRLRRAAQEARNAALAKQGEIAIVRANQDKAKQEYERRIAALQRQHADETAQHRAELEVRGKEMEKMQTDNRFLQHEAAQENERSKRRTVPNKSRTAPASRDTPRRSRVQTLGDGFDDGEVHKGSPSRNREQSREGTPKVGGKRKRAAPDSPSLSFSRSLRQESSENLQSFSEPPPLDSNGLPGSSYAHDSLERVLNHTSFDNQTSTIEALTKYFFPSDPQKSVSSLFMDEVARTVSTDMDQLPLNVYQNLLQLWERCIHENYFAPFPLLLDLLRFILSFELSDFVSGFIEQVVPLCSRSIDLTTGTITKAAIFPKYEQQVDWKAHEKLVKEVDSVEVLDFLLFICHASSVSSERIEDFWRRIESIFLFTLLSKALPISHITVALQMLQTSVLTTTFGPICDDAERQVKQEHGTIERLTNLLFEIPTPPKDEPAYSDLEISEFRLKVLRLLKHTCLTDHGSTLVAAHRSAIGRVIRFLDGQICKLYQVRPSVGLLNVHDDCTPDQTPHGLVVESINLTTRIFYHVLRTNDNSIDIIQKLNVVQGGYHKFLVSMTRLAFSEQLVLEAGIEDEVVTAAHTILDNLLSPEDGEAVLKAIETPRGTRGSVTEKDTTSGDASEQEEEDTPMGDE